MENSLYVGLSGQMALQGKMDLIAQNIANINTPGYRGQNGVFEEYLSRPQGMKETMSMVWDYGQYQVTDPGPVSITGGPLDVALVGPGFIGIQTPEGIQYTRAGNFTMDAQGNLINAQGMKVAGAGGGAIMIPPDAENIYIDQKGVISTDDGEIGRIMVHEFTSEQILEPAGNGLYKTAEAGKPPTETSMHQGKLEGSNVQGVLEMTRMIDVSREYQMVQRVIQNEHERIRTTIQRLSRSA